MSETLLTEIDKELALRLIEMANKIFSKRIEKVEGTLSLEGKSYHYRVTLEFGGYEVRIRIWSNDETDPLVLVWIPKKDIRRLRKDKYVPHYTKDYTLANKLLNLVVSEVSKRL